MVEHAERLAAHATAGATAVSGVRTLVHRRRLDADSRRRRLDVRLGHFDGFVVDVKRLLEGLPLNTAQQSQV